MTYQELIDTIIFQLGNREGLRSKIQTQVEIIKQRLENDVVFHPYFLLSEDLFYTLRPCENRIPLPEKFIAEWENGALWVEDGTFKPLTKRHPDVTFPEQPQCPAVPSYYMTMGQYFRLDTRPEQEYLVQMYCYRGTDLLTNEANPWLTDGSRWLIAETVVHIARATRDRRGLPGYESEAFRARSEIQAKTEERIHANYEYNMGED